jgi:hypothetical protein
VRGATPRHTRPCLVDSAKSKVGRSDGVTLPPSCPRSYGEPVLVMPLTGTCGKSVWCEPAEARVRPHCVVVDPPRFDDPTRGRQAVEQMLIEADLTLAGNGGRPVRADR